LKAKPTRTNSGWLWLVFALALQACTTNQQSPPAATSEQIPTSWTGWRVSGKAAFVSAADTQTLNMRWHRRATDFETLSLSGTLGMGAFELTRTGDTVSWLDAGVSKPLDTLPIETEWRNAIKELPMEQLGNWLLGYAPPAQDMTGDWRMLVTQWQDAQGWRVPRKIELLRSPVTIRLVLTDWQLEPQR